MEGTLDLRIGESWKDALATWNSPSVPHVIAPRTGEELRDLGEVGQALDEQLAFMRYPDFQTFLNLETITAKLKADPARGVKAISKHELGHRFCPYDTITSMILRHAVKKELEGEKLPYDSESAANLILNLFADMTINTRLSRRKDEDIVWAYQELSADKKDSKLWKVYGRSMELAWDQKILPEKAKLTDEESAAAQEIAKLFEGEFFDKTKWKENIRTYARVISKFLEDEGKDKDSALDNPSGNLPKNIDEKTSRELAKRLAEIGSNGLPTNPEGLREFKEMMAGVGQGDPVRASITFYDRLSDSYNVMFATKPFGRPRVNPFQPKRWTPSMNVGELDVDYSASTGGRIIPGVNTYGWNHRRREARGGLEEVVPNLDLYLDSSMSMPNPVDQISLPVLAGFVVAKKAHRRGANIRSTNFSGDKQCSTQESTRDLYRVFENLVTYYNGGTVFPTDALLAEGQDPKQVLVITDTFLANEGDTAKAITDLRARNKGNRVAIYSLHPVDRADYLRSAGAEVISGTSTDIFKKAIGKADEVYIAQ